MGGQACVLYGAAEFSRDTDLVVFADAGNLQRLQQALDELQADRIAVPPFEQQYLDMGLAVHFRCRHPDAGGVRIDVMSRLRGVDEFAALWERRTSLEVAGEVIEMLSLPDLVQAKKTQLDKDWPMVRRLVDAHYFTHRGAPSDRQITFWLREARSASTLVEIAQRYPDCCTRETPRRPLLALAAAGDLAALEIALRAEEAQEREADRVYWGPLRKELERLRQIRNVR